MPANKKTIAGMARSYIGLLRALNYGMEKSRRANVPGGP
jgi:hypothetical protein